MTESSSDPDDPYFSYDVTWGANGSKTMLGSSVGSLSGSPFVFDRDWVLKDNEQARLAEGALPTDTLPGLILRPRAQNSFLRGR